MSSITDEQRQIILQQIGFMNLMAVSGGRVLPLEDGVDLPCGHGYHVRVRYNRGGDDYTVERVFVRSGREFPKGSQTRVYADQVGEFAYYASCFLMDDGEWTYMG